MQKCNNHRKTWHHFSNNENMSWVEIKSEYKPSPYWGDTINVNLFKKQTQGVDKMKKMLLIALATLAFAASTNVFAAGAGKGKPVETKVRDLKDAETKIRKIVESFSKENKVISTENKARLVGGLFGAVGAFGGGTDAPNMKAALSKNTKLNEKLFSMLGNESIDKNVKELAIDLTARVLSEEVKNSGSDSATEKAVNIASGKGEGTLAEGREAVDSVIQTLAELKDSNSESGRRILKTAELIKKEMENGKTALEAVNYARAELKKEGINISLEDLIKCKDA